MIQVIKIGKTFSNTLLCLCDHRSGADPNCFNDNLGVYPIHTAAKKRDLISLKILIKHGAEVNAIMRSNGRSALHLCADQVKHIIQCTEDLENRTC